MGAVKTKTGCFGPGFKQSAVVVLKTFLSTLPPYLLPCTVVVCPCWGGGVPHPNIGGWGLAGAVVKKGAITTGPKKFSTLPPCQRGKYPPVPGRLRGGVPARKPPFFLAAFIVLCGGLQVLRDKAAATQKGVVTCVLI